MHRKRETLNRGGTFNLITDSVGPTVWCALSPRQRSSISSPVWPTLDLSLRLQQEATGGDFFFFLFFLLFLRDTG